METVFLARAEEQERFLSVIKQLPKNPSEPDEGYLVLVHGHGGIGKTSLLKKYDELLQSHSNRWPWRSKVFRVWVDWEKVRQTNPLFATVEGPPLWAALGVIYSAISRAVADDRRASRLEKELFGQFWSHADAVRRDSVGEPLDEPSPAPKEDAPGPRLASGIADIVTSATIGVPAGAIADSVRSIVKGLTGSVGGAGRRRMTGQRFMQIVGPEQELVDEFADALRELSRRTRPFVITLDTSEILGEALLPLCGVIRSSGSRTVWVVGTRMEDPETALPNATAVAIVSSVPSARLRRIPLAGFDRETIAEYLRRRLGDQLPAGVTVDRVAKATRGGVPLLLQLAVDRLKKDHAPDEVLREVTDDYRIPDVVKDHTTRLLVHLDRPEFRRDRDLIFALVLVYSVDDTELLARMWDVAPAEVADIRHGLSERHDFVLSRSGGPHQDVVNMIRSLLLENDRRPQVRDANQRAIRFVRQRMAARAGGGVVWQLKDAEWTRLVPQLLWHTFWGDIDEGIRLLGHLLPATHALAPQLATALVQVGGYFLPACTPAQRRVINGMRLVFPATPLVATLRSRFREFEARIPVSPLRPAVETLIAAATYPSPVLAANVPAEVWLDVCRLRSPETFGIDLAEQAAVLLRVGAALDPDMSPDLSTAIGKRAESVADRLREAGHNTASDGGVSSVAVAEVGTRFAPNEMTVWWSLGLAHAAARNAEAGVKAYDRAIQLDPNHASLHSNRGLLLAELGKYEEAIRSLDEALRLDPDNAARHANRVEVLVALKRADDAVAAAAEAARLDPSAQRYVTAARVNDWAGRAEAALAALDEAARLEPRVAMLHANRGIVLARLGRDEEALAAYEEAARLEPGNATWHGNRAQVLARLGRNAEALTAYEEAVRLEPGNGAWHGGRGSVLGRLGRDDEALAAYDQALGLAPANAMLHGNRAYTLSRLQRDEEALAAYDEAIRLEPGNGAWHGGRGFVLGRLGRDGEALTAYDQALMLGPATATLHGNRAYTLGRLRRDVEALAAYDEAVRLEQDNVSWRANRAVVLGRLGRDLDALAAYDDAVRLQPDNAAWHMDRAIVLRRLGREDEVLDALERARLLDPRSDAVLSNLGEAYLLAGRIDDALASLRSAVALNPSGNLEASVLLAVLLRHKEPDESRALCLRVADADAESFTRFRAGELHAIRRLMLGEPAVTAVEPMRDAARDWTPADQFQAPLYGLLQAPPSLDVDPLLAVWSEIRKRGSEQ